MPAGSLPAPFAGWPYFIPRGFPGTGPDDSGQTLYYGPRMVPSTSFGYGGDSGLNNRLICRFAIQDQRVAHRGGFHHSGW